MERIELIRGAADMHGYPVLANVVRNRSASLQGRAEVEGAITHYGTTEHKLALHLVRQGESSTLELSASWGRDIGTQNQNGFGTRARYLPDGTPLQLSQLQLSPAHQQCRTQLLLPPAPVRTAIFPWAWR